MKQRKPRHTGPYEPQTLTRAVTHIRLEAANAGKLAALDALAPVYLALCQQYVTLFCTDEHPDTFYPPVFATSLSERWQRVAIQQAAGIAQSWRTHPAQAYQDYVDDLLDYHEQEIEGTLDAQTKEPLWREWHIPELRQTCIQANVNVVELEASQNSTFDYWLKISTLEFRKQVLVPVKLAAYHREALKGKTINTSVTLNKRGEGWWVTLSYDQVVPVHTTPSAPVVGVDVGIANFLTTSDGKHYGTFHGKLRERQQRDREKRRRKAKLRACLEKKGVKQLPSTSSKSGQRLIRHVRQEINRAVNQCFTEHPDAQFAYEQLSVATIKHKARAMNAYMRASNLARIPKQLAWNAAKRGVAAISVKSASTSQECSVATIQIEPTGPTSKRFAVWSVATAHMPISTQRSTSSIAGETMNYAPAWTGKRLKPC